MSVGRVRARVVDGVAVMRLDHPPYNALTPQVCAAVQAALSQFEDDPRVLAIVIGAEGAVFSAGTDVGLLETEAQCEAAALCSAVDGAAKPIVCAVQGSALGIGAELALAAHARVAGPNARIGFSDIGLGLVPGAGGTQRLTRLVGPKVAVQMMTTGRAVNEMVGQQIGLFDQVVAADQLLPRATQLARAMATGDRAWSRSAERRAHLRDGAGFMAVIASERRRRSTVYAKRRVVDCVEAALLLPPLVALTFERAAYGDCLDHAESRALRHVFLAERRISADLLGADSGASLQPTMRGRAMVARLFAAQDRAIIALLAEGISEAEVDGALVSFGCKVGPFGGRDAKGGPHDETVQKRVIAALLAEGARCVEQGMVAGPSDVDVLAVHGMAFPRHRGGPMHAAQQFGLLGLCRQMADWAREDQVWAAPPLVARAALESRGFDAVLRG